MKLQEQVKYLRKQRGLTQKQLSKLSGVNFNTYRSFESGLRGLSSLALDKVMTALKGTIMAQPL